MSGSHAELYEDFDGNTSGLSRDFVADLYQRYAADLQSVRKEQLELRAANPTVTLQLDDLEAEITYLMVREHRPKVMVEIGSLHGWSTTWILRALRDNGDGHLYTHDLIDNARRNVPADLAADRWTFVQGDARVTLAKNQHEIDYLFVDAAHTASFARWYVSELFPAVSPGAPVSVHDVFHTRRPWPFSEGRVVLAWLAERGIGYFTPSRAAAPDVNRHLFEVKRTLNMNEAVHTGRDNPMLFFYMK